MALPRFYCPVDISIGQIIELPASIAHHASRVLRLERGSKLILFNGHGGEFQGRYSKIGRNSATVLIEKNLPIERESPLSITLAQAISSSEKMDWIVQKAVELGVNRIQLLATRRSVVRLSAERAIDVWTTCERWLFPHANNAGETRFQKFCHPLHCMTGLVTGSVTFRISLAEIRRAHVLCFPLQQRKACIIIPILSG